MAATVKIYTYTGVGGDGAAVEGGNDVIRLKLADNNSKSKNDGVPIPPSGFHYTFKKTFALYAEDAPNTGINNCRMWLDGALGWTDVTINVGDEQTDVYEQGVIDPGDAESGKELTDYGEITTVTDLSTYNSGSPLALALAAGWDNTTGRITAYVCIQGKVGPTAIESVLSLEGLTFKVDET